MAIHALKSRRENEVVYWRHTPTAYDSCRDVSRADSGELILSDGANMVQLSPEGDPKWTVPNGKFTPFRPVALPDGGAVWSPKGRGVEFYDNQGTLQKTWGEELQVHTTVPCVHQGTAFVCVRDEHGSRLVGLRADRKDPVFDARLPFFGSGPAVPDGKGGVMLRTDDDRVVAFDGQGKRRWEKTLPERLDAELAVGPDGDAYIGSHKGTLFRLKYEDGTPCRFFKARKDIRAAPKFLPDGRVLVTSFDRHLYCLGSDGDEKWKFDCQDLVDNTPGVLCDGTILVGSNARRVFALSPEGRERWTQDVPFWVENHLVTDGAYTAYVAGSDQVVALRPGGLAADLITCKPDAGLQLGEKDGYMLVGGVPLKKKA